MWAKVTNIFHWLRVYWQLWGIPALLAGGAKATKMWFDLRKARQDMRNSHLEGQRLAAEVAKLTREKAVDDGVLVLTRNVVSFPDAGCHARRILSKSEWTRLLPDPTVIDDVLRELDATPLPRLDDREFWQIDLNPPTQQRRRG
jgi:hypothetical protein